MHRDTDPGKAIHCILLNSRPTYCHVLHSKESKTHGLTYDRERLVQSELKKRESESKSGPEFDEFTAVAKLYY